MRLKIKLIFQDVFNKKNGTDLSEETSLKIAEIIEINHQKVEEMRKTKFAALTKLKYMKDKYDKLISVKDEMEEKMEKLIVSIKRQYYEPGQNWS